MKLAEVAMKQIAKPVSKLLLNGALSNPQVTKSCVWIGQKLHYVNVRVTRTAEGQTTSRRIFELPEEKAREAGALFLGEVIVFTLTGAIVGWQIWMSQKASYESAAKEEHYEQVRAAEKRAEHVLRDVRISEIERKVEMLWSVLEKSQDPQIVARTRSEAVVLQQAQPVGPLDVFLASSMSTPFSD
jgi:hypothetical protein